MFKQVLKTTALLVTFGFATMSNASLVTGTVPSEYGNVTFAGSGIPNDQVSYIDFGNYLLGLAITPRYASAAVTNSGSTYFAEPGLSTNYDPSTQNGSTWNFSFFAAINENLLNVTTFAEAGLDSLELLFDMSNGAGTDFGRIIFDTSLFMSSTPIQNSQNLSFNYLSTTASFGSFSVVAAPGSSVYDQFAQGNFEFKWLANGSDAVAIKAVVGVSEPSTVALLLLTMFGFMGARKLRK